MDLSTVNLYDYYQNGEASNGGSSTAVNHNGFELIEFNLNKRARVEIAISINAINAPRGSGVFTTLSKGSSAASGEVAYTTTWIPNSDWADNDAAHLRYITTLDPGQHTYRVGFKRNGSNGTFKFRGRCATVRVVKFED